MMKQPDKQYRIAATGKFDAAVAYYGGGIQQHHGVADQVTQPILFHDAGQDTHIPQCAVAECESQFRRQNERHFSDYPAAAPFFDLFSVTSCYRTIRHAQQTYCQCVSKVRGLQISRIRPTAFLYQKNFPRHPGHALGNVARTRESVRK
jgi:hypothetical protein